MDVQLVMFKENGDRKEFALNGAKTVVGRKEDCDIRIPLAEVSRQHAEFHIEEAIVRLRDLKSANGTFVNNKRVSEHDLEPGDRVVIGPVVFTVQIDGTPDDIKPAKTKLRRKPDLEPEDELMPAPDLEASGTKGETLDDLAGSTAPGADDSMTDALGESDLALEALADGSSMNFEIDDLDLSDTSTDDD